MGGSTTNAQKDKTREELRKQGAAAPLKDNLFQRCLEKDRERPPRQQEEERKKATTSMFNFESNFGV